MSSSPNLCCRRFLGEPNWYKTSNFNLHSQDVPGPHRLDTKLIFCILLSVKVHGTQKLSQVHRGQKAWIHTVPGLGSSTRAQSHCAKLGQQSRAVMATGTTRARSVEQAKKSSQQDKFMISKVPDRAQAYLQHSSDQSQRQGVRADKHLLIPFIWFKFCGLTNLPHLCILHRSWHTHTQSILIWDS